MLLFKASTIFPCWTETQSNTTWHWWTIWNKKHLQNDPSLSLQRNRAPSLLFLVAKHHWLSWEKGTFAASQMLYHRFSHLQGGKTISPLNSPLPVFTSSYKHHFFTKGKDLWLTVDNSHWKSSFSHSIHNKCALQEQNSATEFLYWGSLIHLYFSPLLLTPSTYKEKTMLLLFHISASRHWIRQQEIYKPTK